MIIDLLKYNQKINIKKEEGSDPKIFCMIRKKYLILTPEEHVRQLFLHHLVDTLGFKEKSITVEKTFRINNLSKRPDILVFDKQGIPYLIIECKAPHIPLDSKTIQQVGFYNGALKCPHTMITNGQDTFYIHIHKSQMEVIDFFPAPPL